MLIRQGVDDDVCKLEPLCKTEEDRVYNEDSRGANAGSRRETIFISSDTNIDLKGEDCRAETPIQPCCRVQLGGYESAQHHAHPRLMYNSPLWCRQSSFERSLCLVESAHTMDREQRW